MIPVNKPTVPKKALPYLSECTKTGWLSSEGPFVKKFENQFSEYIGTTYACTTNSGTSALHLAIVSLGIKNGDEIILPASTIASCYFAIWYTGAKAIPVDVDPDIYTINPDLIEKAITSKTKAIMVVHLFGHPCDMDPIMKIAKKYHLAVIEDAAESHGAEYKGKKVGTIGDIGIFSFYANKLITTGEGGMVVTNSSEVFKKASKLKGLNHSTIRFIHDGIGYKYAMSNLQAAVGLASLEEIEASIAFKRKMAELYTHHLCHIAGLILPTEKRWAKSVYWMYAIRIDKKKFGIERDEVMVRLQKQFDIQTRTFFYNPKTAFKKLHIYQKEQFPVAETIEHEGLYLPSGLGNTFSEFTRVSNAVQTIYKSIQK